jgi:hypothetical protein
MAIIHEELNEKVHIKWIIKEHKFPSRHFLFSPAAAKTAISARSFISPAREYRFIQAVKIEHC